MNRTFQNELPSTLEKYPDFATKSKDGMLYLKGILDIPDTSGSISGSFSVEIHPTEKFPYRFPKMYEVGGAIPVNANWHKYSDNSCCFTVEPDEILICKNGITLLYFVEQIAIPYLAHQLYRRCTGHYLKEYPHGKEGVRLFYTELFKTSNFNIWQTCYEHAFIEARTGRNEKCYCNSNAKHKKCHRLVEEKLKVLGKWKVFNDLKMIGL